MHFAVYFKGPVHADRFRICRVQLHANKFASVTSRNEMADACTRTYYVTSKGTGTALGTRVLHWVSTSKIGTVQVQEEALVRALIWILIRVLIGETTTRTSSNLKVNDSR